MTVARSNGGQVVLPRTLRTAIGTYPHTSALKQPGAGEPELGLEHVGYRPVNRAFRPMVNQLAFDVSELALVTYMLAREHGRPLVGVPVVLMRQSAHEAIACRADSRVHRPEDLAGLVIGVRGYSTTTAVWVRGILQHQYGVPLESLRWVVFEPGHVDGAEDPSNVERAPEGRDLLDMLLSGDVDAAVGLPASAHPDLRWVISDPMQAQQEWSAQTGVGFPVNHTLVVRQELANEDPRLRSRLMHLFEEAREKAAVQPGAVPPPPYGLDANRAAIELLARYCQEEGLVNHLYTADELFPPL